MCIMVCHSAYAYGVRYGVTEYRGAISYRMGGTYSTYVYGVRYRIAEYRGAISYRMGGDL